MKALFLVSLLSLLLVNVHAGEKQAYEIPGTQVVPIQDTHSDRQYELYIKLPEGYSENKDATHPVIYFTDAVWHIELLSASAEYLMEDAILVGISWQKDIPEAVKKDLGAQASRYRDYTVKPSDKPDIQSKYQLGQAGKHLEFIRHDVIPYVEGNYRTDPDNRSYFGYSAGGLFGAYILLAQPDTFQNYILGSPSLKNNLPVLSEIPSNPAKGNRAVASVFISNGTLEEELAVYIKEYIKMLNSKNKKPLLIQHVVLEGTHQTAFPPTGVRGIGWLSSVASNKD